jgi:hypothetical protein
MNIMIFVFNYLLLELKDTGKRNDQPRFSIYIYCISHPMIFKKKGMR